MATGDKVLAYIVNALPEIQLTSCMSFNYSMAKVNNVAGLVISNVFTENHIFIKVSCIQDTSRKSDLLDIRVDVIFAFGKLK
jgi:hypothetical protein